MLQTLHLPLAMRATSAVSLVLTGGTFNPMAPAFSFLEHLARVSLGLRDAAGPGDAGGRLLPARRGQARGQDRAGDAGIVLCRQHEVR